MSESISQQQARLDELSRGLNLQERTLDFIQFRTSFVNNFDFERLVEQTKSLQIRRSGSRSATWKMLLGVLPTINDKKAWIKATRDSRLRYQKLQEKHLRLNNQIQSLNPLASLNNPNMMKEIFSMKDDRDIKTLIKKDVERTFQEIPLFKDSMVQQRMEEILYLWAKEHPDYKYQQGMNDLLAVIIYCVISEQMNNQTDKLTPNTNFKAAQESGEKSSKQILLNKLLTNKLSSKEEALPELSLDPLRVKQSSSKTLLSSDESFNLDEDDYDDQEAENEASKKLYRKLHDSRYVWADCFCMFENLMELGLKGLYFKDIVPTQDNFTQETDLIKNSTDNKEVKNQVSPQKERDLQTYTQLSSMSSHSSKEENAIPAATNAQLRQTQEKEKQRRLRKQRLLELNQEDAKRTSLKRRSNKIFNTYLREIDPQLFTHLTKEVEIQPELISLKYLRCMLSREFKMPSLLYVWDFIIAGISDDGRIYLQEQSADQTKSESRVQDPYFFRHLDYLCLAMIQLQREPFLASDYIGCLKLTSKALKLECHSEVIKIADRIGKVIFEKFVKKDSVIQRDDFPRILEKDVAKFMQEYSLRQNESDDDWKEGESDEENCSEAGSPHFNNKAKKSRKFFRVKEEDEEEDEEEEVDSESQRENSEDEDNRSEMSDNVGDLSMSQQRIKDADEVEAALALGGAAVSKQGSIVIDEEGDTFIDCKDEIAQEKLNLKSSSLRHSERADESFHSINSECQNEMSEGQLDSQDPSEEKEAKLSSKNLFKLKDTKGKVIYDHTTKQRRYMSPFEQFIAEQEGLFKKDEMRQHDEQNSVTLTTTASTNFNDTKTVVITASLRSGSGSLVEEPITLLPKKRTQVMKPNNRLTRRANEMQYDAKVKQAEDQVMLERKANLKQLRSIKGYLSGAKTAKNIHIAQKVQQMAKIQNSGRSSESNNRSFFSFLFA